MRALPSAPARHERATALPLAVRAFALVLFGVLLSQATRAQIYGVTDDSGAVLLSNHEPAGEFVVLVEAPPAPPPLPAVVPAVVPAAAPRVATTDNAPAVAAPLTPRLLTPIIREAARKHALPEALLSAMVSVESGFDGRAVSPKGAKGLMQLMPDTARRFGVKDVFSADQNVHAGAAYMRILLNQFSDDMALALAAYNAGEGAVMRAGRRIPAYPETQQYVRKVMAQAALAPNSNAASRR